MVVLRGYVLHENAPMLSSGYGLLSHRAMVALKDADKITGAHQIQITCPLGTNINGSTRESLTEGNEVVVSRYPMGVPKPVLAMDSLVWSSSRFLTSAGSKVYEPTIWKILKL